MAKIGKRLKAAYAKVDRDRRYTLEEAMQLVVETATAKFDETIELAVRLGVAHPISPETAFLATSKMRQRERFAQAGVPQPRSRVCRDLAEAAAAVEELGYPCVLKAPDRQGQKGLALVRTLMERGEGDLDYSAVGTALP